jgi:hypothetical protein
LKLKCQPKEGPRKDNKINLVKNSLLKKKRNKKIAAAAGK